MPAATVAVITGASSGVGRATALAFARTGARLVLAARSRPALDLVAESCRALGAPVRVAVADVTEPATVEAVAEAAISAYGRLDVWVHTAAVMAYGRFEDVPAEVFERVVTTDLIGAATVARAALARFRPQEHGVLIFGGSLLGTVVTPYTSSYVTSKWGLRALVRALRLETRDAPGIHVCLVAPGSVDTPIYRTAANFAGRFGQPPPPVDSPERVAAAIVRCARRPRATVTLGLASRIIRFGFVATPALYDVLVGPLMRIAGLSRERVAPHTGNVFAPAPQPPGPARPAPARPGWWPAAALAGGLLAWQSVRRSRRTGASTLTR
ncbi:SDR family NAD(P)-dependent oxidoreductase [Actinoplanes teichomyceticus]|uniref:Short-subunit dehydrogenase n=1 Tax=Actinoplanes teichomyceticus TaxID=1867 RepID=A0A561VLE4_ACTTI|nr:SDR family NAD(P)-dependent oxidoreductase [Actinoplanes teichomyceticus]TWG12414.1 short-subunit dehydrogenase [Actinoplanes teichomyceticus]GIF13775.1 short-chain dehydrogenase [Actinoplanes teichomyceticus]